MKTIYKWGTVLIMCSMFISRSPSQTVLFDFDNASLHSSLPMTLNVGGITAHFTASGTSYSIQTADVLGFTPVGFSGYVLYPNSIFLADLRIKFESAMTYFSIMYACEEYGCDDAGTVRATAYMNGTYVGTNTMTATNPGTWPVDTLKFTNGQSFDSVVVHYDAQPPTCGDWGPIFMADNMKVTPLTPLSVTLLYFTCEAKQNTAILKWGSAEEINLNSYIVQYSKDAIHFHDLATINADGSYHDYGFIDPNVNGTAYYRLKMLDKDGALKYSETRKLLFQPKTDIRIVPNPAYDHIRIYSGNPLELKTIQILSTDGVILRTIRNYSSSREISIRELPKGPYILKVFFSKDELPIEKIFVKL